MASVSDSCRGDLATSMFDMYRLPRSRACTATVNGVTTFSLVARSTGTDPQPPRASPPLRNAVEPRKNPDTEEENSPPRKAVEGRPLL